MAGGSHDGLAALRQRLFFARTLLGLAERELAGDALNRQARAMACRHAAVLELHAVLTGLLDEIVLRLRLDPAGMVPALETTRALLDSRGLTSPELGRLEVLAEPGGWLHACLAEVRHCLSASAAGRREAPAGDAGAQDGGPVRISLVADGQDMPLSDPDLARLRGWIDAWQALLDEFLETFVEF